ncbi:MAG TPA: nitroreductase family protein [Roseiflexaceae bacterium]|nr:nitroreductase family protein [Roseiflexaceae bacterium]
MELIEIMRSQSACRYYTPDPIPDEVLARVLDAARWAPQGGNRQPVRFVVVRNPETKRIMKEWYLEPWNAYLAAARQGGITIGSGEPIAIPKALADADHFAQHLDEVPVWVLVCAVMADIHPTDLELDRPTVVYGASIYPAVQNLLLKAREEGLGSTLTTLLCHAEPRIKELLRIPDGIATCAMLTLGWPARPFPKQLSRRPLTEIVFDEHYGEPLYR